MHSTRPLFPSPCLGATILMTLTGCAGRSAAPGPPVATQQELEPYGGAWVLEPSEGPRGEGIRMGIPMERIGGPSEAAQNELRAALVAYPRSFTLEVSDSLFTLSANPTDQSFTLPIDGSRRQIRSEGGRGRPYGSIMWNNGALTIERQFRENGWITDHLQLTGDGKLVLARTSGFGEWEGKGSLRFVYVRGAGSVMP